MWLRCQAQVAALTGDRDACERLLGELTPYSGEWLVALYGCEISGPVDLWAGLLEAALGRRDEAITRLTAAAASADRMRMRPWAAEIRSRLASVLAARGAPGDAERAAALTAAVRAEAAELDMPHLVSPHRFRCGFPGRTTSSAGPARCGRCGSPAAKSACRTPKACGTCTSCSAARVPRCPRFACCRRKAANRWSRPGASAVTPSSTRRRRPPTAVVSTTSTRRSTGPRPATTTRRAAALDREREALLQELRTAAGLGGRTRRLGDESERARKAVTARIRDTLRKLTDLHPELAEHLTSAVTTGSSCRYAPDPETRWQL